MRTRFSFSFGLIADLSWKGFLGIAVGLGGCGQSTSPVPQVSNSMSQCSAGAVEIMVGDGFLQTRCGCSLASEASGTVYSTPAHLTCHLSSSSAIVFFYYLGTVLPHKIESTSTPGFVVGPVSDPQSNFRIRVHAVSLTQSATAYSFIDVYSGMVGTIYTQ